MWNLFAWIHRYINDALLEFVLKMIEFNGRFFLVLFFGPFYYLVKVREKLFITDKSIFDRNMVLFLYEIQDSSDIKDVTGVFIRPSHWVLVSVYVSIKCIFHIQFCTMDQRRNHLNPKRSAAIGLQVAMIYWRKMRCRVEQNVNSVRIVGRIWLCLRKFRQTFWTQYVKCSVRRTPQQCYDFIFVDRLR